MHMCLRFVCASITLLATVAVQATTRPPSPGNVLDFVPVQRFGKGGENPHPHIVMGPVSNPIHPEGHNLVLAPVTHSEHEELGPFFPVPANPKPFPNHALEGNVLPLRTGHSSAGVRKQHANGLGHGRVHPTVLHTIAEESNIHAAAAHQSAAQAHTDAALHHSAAGNKHLAEHHTGVAAHHKAMFETHLEDAHKYNQLSQGRRISGPFHHKLEDITTSLRHAESAAADAHVDNRVSSAREKAADAHLGAAKAHAKAAQAHLAAAEHNPHGGHQHQAHEHTILSGHHITQALRHMDPNRANWTDPHKSQHSAHASHLAAFHSKQSALRHTPQHDSILLQPRDYIVDM